MLFRSSVLFLLFTGKLWNYVELKGINKKLWRQMLNFSLPMIPAQISFWIINASDLFFVREMCEGLDGRTGNAEGPAGTAEKIIYRKNGGKFPWKTKKRPAINIPSLPAIP